MLTITKIIQISNNVNDKIKNAASSTLNLTFDKECIRKEIRRMRHTRDSLVHQRQLIDEKHQRVSTMIGSFSNET